MVGVSAAVPSEIRRHTTREMECHEYLFSAHLCVVRWLFSCGHACNLFQLLARGATLRGPCRYLNVRKHLVCQLLHGFQFAMDATLALYS